jgi:hypothetical protein
MKKEIGLVCLFFILIACSKGTKYSKIPKISFYSLSDSILKASTAKKVYITFDFKDGNGDIGFKTANLFLIDSRKPSDTQKYLIPEIPSKFDPSNGLEGLIQLETNGAFLSLRDDTIHKKRDTLVWSLFMKDQAGNQSNVIETNRVILKDSL